MSPPTVSIVIRQKIECFFQPLENLIDRIYIRLQKEQFSFNELFLFIAIGALTNLYFLANFSFSIDDELGSVRENAVVWIGQGRWTVYLVETFIFPQPVIPYVPFIVLVVLMAISYTLIIRAHDFKPNWKTVLTYPLFCAFPTWYFISEFYSNIPSVAIGLLLVSIATYITFKDCTYNTLVIKKSFSENLSIVTLITFATGAYQSFILLYFCISIGIALIKVLKNKQPYKELVGNVLRKFIHIGLLALSALICYALINYAAQNITNEHSPYIGSFISKNAWITAPLWMIFSVLKEIIRIYFGSTDPYGATLSMAPVLLFFSTLSVFLLGRRKLILTLLMWGFALIIPFTLHFLAGPHAMPLRSMMALAYITWLMGMLVLIQERRIFKLIGLFVILIYQLQMISLTSQYQAYANIRQDHDKILAADLYRRISEIGNNFDRNVPVEIDIFGYKKIETNYIKGWSSTTFSSFFSWDGGDLLRMLTYLKIMGYQNLNMPNESERHLMTPIFQKMPVWPATGSVKKVGNRYLIRLSKEADPVHAKDIN